MSMQKGDVFGTIIEFNPNLYLPVYLSFVISNVSGRYCSFQQVDVEYLISLRIISIEVLS